MNAAIITAVLAFIIGLFGGYQWQAQNITQLKLEYEQQQSDNARAALKSIEHHSRQIADAQSHAQTRRAVVAGDRVRAGNAASGLRDTTAGLVRASAETPAACPDTAATLALVFGECTSRLVEVAESADQWTSESLMLRDAWPSGD